MPITTSYSRGTVVLLPFPFSDLSAAKLRPSVVVSGQYPSDDLIVVAITSVGASLRPGEFPIGAWREAGLIHPSFMKRAIASISPDLIRKVLGKLSKVDLTQLDQSLRLWFGL